MIDSEKMISVTQYLPKADAADEPHLLGREAARQCCEALFEELVSTPEQNYISKPAPKCIRRLALARRKWPLAARMADLLGGAERSSPEAA